MNAMTLFLGGFAAGQRMPVPETTSRVEITYWKDNGKTQSITYAENPLVSGAVGFRVFTLPDKDIKQVLQELAAHYSPVDKRYADRLLDINFSRRPR